VSTDGVLDEWTTQPPVGGGNRPYVDHPTCPRKPELAGNRKCLKKCRSDDECRGRNRRCFCDDVCGKSCVRPSEAFVTFSLIRFCRLAFKLVSAIAKQTETPSTPATMSKQQSFASALLLVVDWA